MSTVRRSADRRRRVLYSAAADTGPSTAASRREAARLREARRPVETFGSRVHRQLRARWYGLVPVRRRTASILIGVITSATLLLCYAHYMAVTWPAIVDRGDISRPLRLDRNDSFGHWMTGMLMIGSAGAALLIYQLRRHRLDDFHGHYRLWRWALVAILLTSMNSVVGMIDWAGALLDMAVGRRVALSGTDWIRIVVSLAGAVLAIRLLAELRHCRSALLAMLVTIVCWTIPEAARWNFLTVESIERWALVTAAPLLATTALFVSLGLYLRMLYRQVRRFDETDRLADRLQQIRLRVFQRSDAEWDADDVEDHDDLSDTEPRRRWWRPGRRSRDDSMADDATSDQVSEYEEEEYTEAASNEDSDANDDPPPRKKRRWFGLRAAKTEIERAGDEAEPVTEDQPTDNAPNKKRRGRFSMRLKPTATQTATPNESEPAEQPDDQPDCDQAPKRRFGLGAFRKQRAAEAAEAEAQQDPSTETTQNQSAVSDDYIDPDEIDWSSLSKSERRRLRKQIKRQKAA